MVNMDNGFTKLLESATVRFPGILRKNNSEVKDHEADLQMIYNLESFSPKI